MNTAAKVRAEKDAHPERFCASKKCLWRIATPSGPNPCRKHPFENLVASFGPERFDLSATRKEG